MVFRLKMSKILNRAEKFEKLLADYGAGVTNLQYFCALKKIVIVYIQTNNPTFIYND